MTTEVLSEASLKKLRLNHVRTYAERRGWRRQGLFRDVIAVFDHGPQSHQQLLVPTNPDFDDFAEQMQRVVHRLAQAESRSAASVLEDILSLDVDTIRFSVRSTAAARGTLPLEDGLALLDGARRSLLAAACTVLAPEQTYHPRMSRSEAEDFIRTCELGQTEKGSYTVTLKCPLHELDRPPEATAQRDVPFARRATQTLARSVAQIARAIDQDRIDALLRPVQDVQVTANLCDALIKMQPDQEAAALVFSVSWASTQPQPPRVELDPVVLRNEHFAILGAVSKQLRGEIELLTAQFIAHVDELRGILGEDGRRQGEVRLTLYQEDEVIKARVNLNADQYARAIQAHVAAHATLVRGVLNRGPRISTLSDVESFELLPQVGPGIP